MSRIAVTLWTLAMLGLPFAAAVRADDTCAVACADERRNCVQDAGNDKLACRIDCRAAAGAGAVGGCLRDCRAGFRTERATCRTTALGCVTACDTGDTPESEPPAETSGRACQGVCGAGLAQCLRGVMTGMPDCMDTCDRGRDRHACAEGCRAAAKDGPAVCREEHDACLAGCGGTSTTTTTLPPPAPCDATQAPTCGGLCPETGLSCAEIEPGVCGCVGGSPSAAFLLP